MRFEATQPIDITYMPEEARPIMMADTKGITAFDEKGLPVAVCVFDSWSYNSCQIHIWIENAFVLRSGFAEEVFNFVFDSGRTMIIGVTPADNDKALKFIKHMGFEEVYRIKDGYKIGVDYVITEIHKENCRYSHGR